MPATARDEARGHKSTFLFLLVWGFLVFVAILAVAELKAPAPVPASAPITEFSAERALAQLRAFATAPHPVGSKEDATVRDYLVQQLSALGLNPQVFSAVGARTRGEQAIIANTHDVLGRLPGSANSGAIMLIAHYDSVNTATGAADDGSAVVAILEAVRALRARSALKNDVIVLFTDGEEAGLLGAEAFAASHPWMKDVGLILNFEARGDQGPALLFETSRDNALLINAATQSTAPVLGSSLFYSLYKLLPNDTDFTVFRPYNIPGLNFAFGENLDAYHTRLDTIGNLSTASLQHHGEYALGLVQQFGQMDLARLKDSKQDDIFFDWLGSHLITYGEGWVLPGEILALVLLIFTIALGLLRSEVKPGRIFLALLPSLALLLAILVVMAGVAWLVSMIIGRRMIVGDSTANASLLWGCVLLGTWAGSMLFAAFSKRFSIQELSFAGLFLMWILSLALAWMLPAGSYLLFWPLLLVILGLLIIALAKRANHPGFQGLAVLPGATMTVLIFAPVIHLLYIFLTLNQPPIAVAAAGLLVGSFYLICAPLLNITVCTDNRNPANFVLIAAAVVSLGVGVVLSHSSAQHPHRDSILFCVNADDHTASWISYDGSPDGWTSQFFGNGTLRRQPAPIYLAGPQRLLLSAPAPLQELPGPVAETRKDTTQGSVRNLQLNVKSPREARTILISFEKGVQVVSIKVGTREITPRRSPGFSRITLIGPDAQGFDLELAVRGSSPVSFWLTDQSSGLPGPISPRPTDLMAVQNTDETMVSRRYSF